MVTKFYYFFLNGAISISLAWCYLCLVLLLLLFILLMDSFPGVLHVLVLGSAYCKQILPFISNGLNWICPGYACLSVLTSCLDKNVVC